MRKLIHPGQSIGLPLTAKERKLLIEKCLIIDDSYLDRIREAPPRKAEVPFKLDELEDFGGQVAFEANHAKSRATQKLLDGVHDKIEQVLATYTDDPEVAKADAASVIAPNLLAPLRLLKQQIEAAGVDVNALRERLQPKVVKPDERLPVRMSAAEKALVLELRCLSESTMSQIRHTPPTKRVVMLTLRQVNELEPLVYATHFACGIKERKRKWGRILDNLREVQIHYSDGTKEPVALPPKAAGKRRPSPQAVQDILQWLMSVEKKDREGPL